MLKYLSIIFESLAFLVSIFCIKKNKGSYIEWMSLFLFYIILTECLGLYFTYYLHKPTTPIYLVYQIVSSSFYSYLFYKLLTNNKYIQRFIFGFALINSLILCYIFIFISNFIEFNYKMKIIDGIYFVSISCIYLYTQFMDDELEELLINKPGFWIAAGLLLFYSAYSIVITLHPITSKNKIFVFGLPLHNFFAQVLSVILYTCFSAAMIVWKPKTTTSS